MKDTRTPLGVVLTARLSGAYRQVRSIVEFPFGRRRTGTEIRTDIVELHAKMQTAKGFTDERVVQAVMDYTEVDYIFERLTKAGGTLIQPEELQLIIRIIDRYCYFASNVAARSRLSNETKKKMGDEATAFARFHAGVFALARGNQAAAGNYFSGSTENHWKVDAKELTGYVAAEKFDDVASLLGDGFSRLKCLVPPAEPTVVDRKKRSETISLETEPLLRMQQERLIKLSAAEEDSTKVKSK